LLNVSSAFVSDYQQLSFLLMQPFDFLNTHLNILFCSILVNGQQVEKRVTTGYLVRLFHKFSHANVIYFCTYWIVSSVYVSLQLSKFSQKLVSIAMQDVGPQMPSDVTRLVKVGANVLQIIGEFSGKCCSHSSLPVC
jgi:hypothetical protein